MSRLHLPSLLVALLWTLPACDGCGDAGPGGPGSDGGVAPVYEGGVLGCPAHARFYAGVCFCEDGYTGEDCAECAEGFRPLYDRSAGTVAPVACVARCDDVECSGHGRCEAYSDGFACACDRAWAGARCERCGPGHEPDGDACVDLCAGEDCSGHGVCDSYTGRIYCLCDPTFAGPRCEGCAVGYRPEGGLCVEVCEADSCSSRGTCDGSSGQPVCTCDDTWGGARCEQCARGYRAGAGTCVPDCQADTCYHGGTCQDGGSYIWCACPTGYDGDYCELCDRNYLEVNGACVHVCEGFDCNDHGDCQATSGTPGCACYANYQGERCAACAPGYSAVDGHCIVPAVDLVAGQFHTCAKLADGRHKCWGDNNHGKLGYLGNYPPRWVGCGPGQDLEDSFIPDLGVSGAVEHLALGSSQSCGIFSSGGVRCWGSAVDGLLGYGNLEDIGDDEWPDTAGWVSLGAQATGLGLGSPLSCAVLDGGGVRCWGRGEFLGLGPDQEDIGDTELPTAIAELSVSGTATHIAVGGYHACVLLDDGKVRCWGVDNYWGLLGTPSPAPSSPPSANDDVELGGPALQLSLGAEHSCAVLQGGSVVCWGDHGDGQLGLGQIYSRFGWYVGDGETPAAAGPVDVGGVAVQVAAGQKHSCVLLQGGAVRCWGDNSAGQLGQGNTDRIGDDEAPASIAPLDLAGPATKIAAGNYHSCALLENGTVRCWGSTYACVCGPHANTNAAFGDDEPMSEVPPLPLFR